MNEKIKSLVLMIITAVFFIAGSSAHAEGLSLNELISRNIQWKHRYALESVLDLLIGDIKGCFYDCGTLGINKTYSTTSGVKCSGKYIAVDGEKAIEINVRTSNGQVQETYVFRRFTLLKDVSNECFTIKSAPLSINICFFRADKKYNAKGYIKPEGDECDWRVIYHELKAYKAY